MSINEEFGLDEVLGGIESAPPEKVSTKKKKAAAPKVIIDVPAPPEPEVFIDPEDDRENWPTIRIDSEEGKPNYEYVAAHGTKKDGSPFGWDMQIMRGVEVKVPPSIVYCLRDAVSTHISLGRDPVTGKTLQHRSDRSAIPWRLVRGGKYFA